MKLVAAEVSATALDFVGISVFREGTIIYLPTVTLEVATACSGLRSVVLVLTVGSFYAFWTQEVRTKRVVIILSAFPIAIIANIVRIILTALLSLVASASITQGFIHDFSGVFVFVVAGMSFVALGRVLDTLKPRKTMPDGRIASAETVS